MVKDKSLEIAPLSEVGRPLDLSDLTAPSMERTSDLPSDRVISIKSLPDLVLPTLSEARAISSSLSSEIEVATFSIPRGATFHACSTQTEIDTFIEMRNSLHPDRRLMLTPYTAEEYRHERATLYLDENLGGGFGLTDIGELISVFSLPGRRLGQEIILKGIELGGKIVSCFDIQSKLPELYEAFGFREYHRIPWDSAQAPAEWNYARFGQPDVIYMKRIGE